MASQNDHVYLAIDIEKVDDYQGSSIVAFGACLGDNNGNVIVSKAWYPAMPRYSKFGTRCKTEFWDKQPGLYESFVERSLPAAVAYQSFVNWLDGLEETYPNITILSDNPTYDLGSLDNKIEKYCDRLPVRYTSDGKYRWISDWSEQASALGCYGRVKEIVGLQMGERAKLTHNPEIDAESIYRCSLVTERLTRLMSVELNKLVDNACKEMLG
jgi:hypothetical protein